MRTRDIEKEQLVKQKAIEMLVDEGFEHFSVNKLARACGISVATLYIYYKDKDDLIINIAEEEARRMNTASLEGFDPEMHFEEGLKVQWKMRAKFMLEHPRAISFLEQLRSSSYHDRIYNMITEQFKAVMGKFMMNAVKRGEIDQLPLEVYWSIAFAPLYNLLRFHNEGRSVGGRPFVISDKVIWETFALVVKALKK